MKVAVPPDESNVLEERLPGRMPGEHQEHPHRDAKRDDTPHAQAEESWPSRRPASSARLNVSVGVRVWVGPGQQADWGKPRGVALAKLRSLAQAALPSLREGANRAGPRGKAGQAWSRACRSPSCP